jgi:hypothetical protein
MTKHIAEEALLALVDGAGAPSDRAHVEACESCAMRLDEARAGLELALRAEVPEPSALYWEAFRRNVGRMIDAEPRGRVLGWRRLLVLAAAAATVAVVALSVGHVPRPSGTLTPLASTAVVPAWSALPPTERDEGFAVLEGLATANAGLASWDEGRGLGSFLAGLTDQESQALADTLRGAGQEVEL